MAEKQIAFFERYLTIWVLICIGIGIGVGYLAGDSIQVISDWEIYKVNIPVAILIWLMIYPMMLQVDFASLKEIGKSPKGVVWTVIINWAIKPFTWPFLPGSFLIIYTRPG